MSERLLIAGGRVFDPGRSLDETADVLIEAGVILEIGPGLARDGAEFIDATGMLVVPGFVDIHAHLREPGFEHKGTVATETAAAARGGFTTVCAMPNTDPAPDSASAIESLLERIRMTAVVRVLPIGTITKGRAGKEIAELAELAEAGVIAFSDDGNPVPDAAVMRRALVVARSLGLPISEHSDDPVLNAGGVMNEGRISERLGLAGQPAAAEITAIGRNIALAEATGGHMHIAHISTARGVELVADAKARGLGVTCEVTPSHLFLTEDTVFGPGPDAAYETNARVNPPLRTEADRRALIEGLRTGVIDAIATDHAPHAIEDKLCEFDFAAPGISCAETAFGTLATQIERGELPLDRVIEALTSGPARVFNLGSLVPGIGSLVEGGVADIAVLSLTDRWTVDPAAFVSKGKNTPLTGMTLAGRVVATVCAGRVVFQVESVEAVV